MDFINRAGPRFQALIASTMSTALTQRMQPILEGQSKEVATVAPLVIDDIDAENALKEENMKALKEAAYSTGLSDVSTAASPTADNPAPSFEIFKDAADEDLRSRLGTVSVADGDGDEEDVDNGASDATAGLGPKETEAEPQIGNAVPPAPSKAQDDAQASSSRKALTDARAPALADAGVLAASAPASPFRSPSPPGDSQTPRLRPQTNPSPPPGTSMGTRGQSSVCFLPSALLDLLPSSNSDAFYISNEVMENIMMSQLISSQAEGDSASHADVTEADWR